MGLHSWLTSDTQKSIRWGDKRPVYILQPGGKPPIAETAYDGYGHFGGYDAYLWLFEHNQHLINGDISELSDFEKRAIAIYLEDGEICCDPATGKFYHVDADLSCVVPGEVIRYYFDVVPGFGKSARELLDCGRFTLVPLSEILNIQYPLKFSFNPNAIYELLPAAKTCPWQGMPPEDSPEY